MSGLDCSTSVSRLASRASTQTSGEDLPRPRRRGRRRNPPSSRLAATLSNSASATRAISTTIPTTSTNATFMGCSATRTLRRPDGIATSTPSGEFNRPAALVVAER
jgi:hypothetical protein